MRAVQPFGRGALPIAWGTVVLLAAGAAMAAGDGSRGPTTVLSISKNPARLDGTWLLHTGDDPGWAARGLPDGDWRAVYGPASWDEQGFPNYEGFAWYRLHFRLADTTLPARMELSLGQINDADETFLNGTLVGHTGRFPPNPESVFTKERHYPFDSALLDPGGENVLAFRIWHNDFPSHKGGFVVGRPQIGPSEQLQRTFTVQEQMRVGLALVVIFIGLYHLPLFLCRRQAREYLYFTLMCIGIGLFGLFRSQTRFIFTGDFALMLKLEQASVYFGTAAGAAFLMTLLQPLRAWHRYFACLPAILGAVVLLVPGLRINSAMLPVFYLVALALMAYGGFLVVRETVRGNPEARTVITGLGVMFLSAATEMAVALNLINVRVLGDADLLGPGFTVLLLSMAVALSGRFLRLHNELGEQRATLEASSARSQELLAAAERLAHEMMVAVADMDEVARSVAVQAAAQLSASSSVTEAATELAALSRQTAASAKQALVLAGNSREQAATANQTLSKLVSDFLRTMAAIGQTGERLMAFVEQAGSSERVNEVIREIAEGLKLLSINAQLEATHAGERGLGFLVVARELQRMSDSTLQHLSSSSRLLQQIRVGAEKATFGTREILQLLAKHLSELQDSHGISATISANFAQTSSAVEAIAEAAARQQTTIGQVAVAMRSFRAQAGTLTEASSTLTGAVMRILAEHKALKQTLGARTEEALRAPEQAHEQPKNRGAHGGPRGYRCPWPDDRAAPLLPAAAPQADLSSTEQYVGDRHHNIF